MAYSWRLAAGGRVFFCIYNSPLVGAWQCACGKWRYFSGSPHPCLSTDDVKVDRDGFFSYIAKKICPLTGTSPLFANTALIT
jgi:hypothetical protein